MDFSVLELSSSPQMEEPVWVTCVLTTGVRMNIIIVQYMFHVCESNATV